MPRILGYGEDALTLWALTHRSREIFTTLNDMNPASEAIAFYRPSFGRRGSAPVPSSGVADSAQFGEFDAILGTPSGVYLVETKWSRSSEIEAGTVVVRPEQVRRHEVFQAYLEAWRSRAPKDWTDFIDAQGSLLEVGSLRVPIAPAGSQLARNLETVLSGLRYCGTAVTNVLLYVRLMNGAPASTVSPDSFRLVTIDCPSDAGFVDLTMRPPVNSADSP